MGKKTFLSDVDLALNQLLQAKLENLPSDPVSTESRIYYNSVIKKPRYHNGTTWLTIMDNGFINDNSSSLSEVLSASKVLALIAGVNSSIAGALLYKGGYDASNNVPVLDNRAGATPIILTQGWTYVVTVAGQFFSENVAVGDMLICKATNAITLADWTVVNKNIPDILSSAEGVVGILAIATTAMVTAGTDDTTAITPLKLKQALGNGVLSLAKKYTVTMGNGAALTFDINHGILSSVTYSIYRTASPFDYIDTEVIVGSVAGHLTVNFNIAPLTEQYTIVVVG